MRSEFEKWCYETGLVTNNRFFDNNGWKSVNEEVTTAFDAWNHQQSKVDELQKRVDKALTILSSKKKMYVDMIIEIEQALKGDQ